MSNRQGNPTLSPPLRVHAISALIAASSVTQPPTRWQMNAIGLPFVEYGSHRCAPFLRNELPRSAC
jgi:hypothetical protein